MRNLSPAFQKMINQLNQAKGNRVVWLIIEMPTVRDSDLELYLARVQELDKQRQRLPRDKEPPKPKPKPNGLSPAYNASDYEKAQNILNGNYKSERFEVPQSDLEESSISFGSAYNYEQTYSPKKRDSARFEKPKSLGSAFELKNHSFSGNTRSKTYTVSEEDYLLLQRLKDKTGGANSLPSRGKPRLVFEDEEGPPLPMRHVHSKPENIPNVSVSPQNEESPPPLPIRKNVENSSYPLKVSTGKEGLIGRNFSLRNVSGKGSDVVVPNLKSRKPHLQPIDKKSPPATGKAAKDLELSKPLPPLRSSRCVRPDTAPERRAPNMFELPNRKKTADSLPPRTTNIRGTENLTPKQLPLGLSSSIETPMVPKKPVFLKTEANDKEVVTKHSKPKPPVPEKKTYLAPQSKDQPAKTEAYAKLASLKTIPPTPTKKAEVPEGLTKKLVKAPPVPTRKISMPEALKRVEEMKARESKAQRTGISGSKPWQQNDNAELAQVLQRLKPTQSNPISKVGTPGKRNDVSTLNFEDFVAKEKRSSAPALEHQQKNGTSSVESLASSSSSTLTHVTAKRSRGPKRKPPKNI
ncbi:LAMI_0E04830g1_1 [Lachancea mirantina]|uniref:LAMI_0E04830g1_1 n=1 Tax=Lachancea mirantina TaxID=1230905 RepID=A0A1G4JL64_9SACH|nr:LAMI_0E04830g1_1 [Lachancea mirantina]